MEQYIHTLIAVDSGFAPRSAQVATFFGELISQHKFNPISEPGRSPEGLAVAKPSGRLRWAVNTMTGEEISVTHYDRFDLAGPEAIPDLIENSEHYTVMQSGQWVGKDRPILLLQTDGTPYPENYLATVRCELRPEAVSTSAWDLEAGPNLREVPEFGSDCKSQTALGIFPNPWTGAAIEVADAGCARFWIEFEFGRFIYPRITNNLEVLSPVVVSWAEQCFQTKLAQGCRLW